MPYRQQKIADADSGGGFKVATCYWI